MQGDWHGISQPPPSVADDSNNDFRTLIMDRFTASAPETFVSFVEILHLYADHHRDFRQDLAFFDMVVQFPREKVKVDRSASERHSRTGRLRSQFRQHRDGPLDSSVSALLATPNWSSAHRRKGSQLVTHFASRISSDQPDDSGLSVKAFLESWDGAVRHVLEGFEKYWNGGRGEGGTDEHLDYDRFPTASPPPFERLQSPVARRLDDGGCLIATLYDAYGDGWSGGAELSIVLEVTGEVLFSGVTLKEGEETSVPLCGFGCGCFVGQATARSYQTEKSWEIANSEGTVVAQATADGASTFCFLDVCLACVAGSYSSYDGTACVLCPAGQYKDDSGSAASCIKCGAGRYNENSGSTTESDCMSCGLGKYSASSSAACDGCKPGKFGPIESSEACVECGAGRYNENSGSATESDCMSCGLGKYSASSSAACFDCKRGSFSSSVGMAACTLCSAGEYTVATKSTSPDDCQPCPEGEYGDLVRGACVSCSTSAGKSCIIVYTVDLDEAMESAEERDTIVLTPGTTYTGSVQGCGTREYGKTALCVATSITIKCSDSENGCSLSGRNERRIMRVDTSGADEGITLEDLSFDAGNGVSTKTQLEKRER